MATEVGGRRALEFAEDPLTGQRFQALRRRREDPAAHLARRPLLFERLRGGRLPARLVGRVI
ncbi:hypothetical protein [Streptomyces sp. PT12]|uniref:hypothetical protein n=1 Tax=Streptomyces sp. PT12 TaxID=1510197 RepID=UPI000DE56C92|nr:hypothetical protein [Streptomyces sp. PT12]RBM23354.1 hypothetical protein DEH69_03335 [Streptomyces sp. PT12]